MTQLLVNATTLTNRPTGLGVYSSNCISAISHHLDAEYISSEPRSRFTAPKGIEIGSGKLGAIKRAIWLNTRRVGTEYLLYSPTHHGCMLAQRQIITIHDLIAVRQPKQHPNQYRYFKYFLPHLLDRCEAVFTVSEFTKNEIFEFYKYPLAKIHVVPNGVNREIFEESNVSRTATTPYILVVGANYPHKNIDELLRNFSFWKDAYHLVIASCTGSERGRLSEMVAKLGLDDSVKFPGYLSLNELIDLYRGASALVYPSLIEGFGIPPLEAIACGTPVIASNIPVLREVLGDSAFFISIGDVESWRKAFSAIRDANEIQKFRNLREPLLQKWTWERSAERLISAILSVEPNVKIRAK